MAETIKTCGGLGWTMGSSVASVEPEEKPMQPTLDVVGLVVDDMARTLAFYRELGLDLPPEADGEPHVELALASGLRLTWDTVDTIRSFDPGWQAPAGGGSRIGLAFLCASPAEVDAAYDKLVGVGHEGHLPPWDAFWGQRYAVVHDPDGNGVDLFAPLPTAPAPDA
jgi:catechol 2,3-dioxygenase-like lactoylglutathione lyase family enzyme